MEKFSFEQSRLGRMRGKLQYRGEGRKALCSSPTPRSIDAGRWGPIQRARLAAPFKDLDGK
jgi:hypothetical protein